MSLIERAQTASKNNGMRKKKFSHIVYEPELTNIIVP